MGFVFLFTKVSIVLTTFLGGEDLRCKIHKIFLDRYSKSEISKLSIIQNYTFKVFNQLKRIRIKNISKVDLKFINFNNVPNFQISTCLSFIYCFVTHFSILYRRSAPPKNGVIAMVMSDDLREDLTMSERALQPFYNETLNFEFIQRNSC